MKNNEKENIVKVDINGKQISNGDVIEIEICAASAFNNGRVVKIGKVLWSYIMMAYCIVEENDEITPLCNFAPSCKFKKLTD